MYELQVHQVELEMQNESLRRAQLDANQSQEQYRALFDFAPVGYLMLDATGAVVRANVAALALLRVARTRLIGQRLGAFVVVEDMAVLKQHLESVESESPCSCELRLRSTGDRATDVRLDISAFPGLPNSRMVVMTDITSFRLKLEAEQRSTREREGDHVARTAELTARNERLEVELQAQSRAEGQRREAEERWRDTDRFESLGLLAAGIAHNFNNLLVRVLGNSDLLLQSADLPEAWRGPLSSIKRAGREASYLTRQLLVFAGRGSVRLVPIDLASAIADCLELLRPRLTSGVRILTLIDKALPSIEADRAQVDQVLTNLVLNAIEAVGESGEIAIHAWEEVVDERSLARWQHHVGANAGRFVVVQVRDSGPGIDASTMVRIFDPFFTTKFTGRGLGLAAARGIVEGHHGLLRVWTHAGRGTSFDVAFKLADAPRASERPPAVGKDEWTGTVLLIDDDDTVRSVVSQLLQRLGFEVTAASSGTAGLAHFCQPESHFDLVVLDWLMPEMSGEQVFLALRGIERSLPILLISGTPIDDVALDDPRVARVQKPMTLGDLREGIRRVLEKTTKLRIV